MLSLRFTLSPGKTDRRLDPVSGRDALLEDADLMFLEDISSLWATLNVTYVWPNTPNSSRGVPRGKHAGISPKKL
jgi:hypothetical protein